MRIRTEKGVLVQLSDIAWSSMTYDCLLKLSLAAPNLTLDATEVHTNRRVRVKLYQLDYDFRFCSHVNLPTA